MICYEDYEEILSPVQRANNYFQVLDNDEKLVAFFCLERINDQKVEIGLGMKPLITGNGLGSEFMKVIEEFIKLNTNYEVLLLSVVKFNQRALKVYQHAGFKIIGTENSESNGGVYEFIILVKTV